MKSFSRANCNIFQDVDGILKSHALSLFIRGDRQYRHSRIPLYAYALRSSSDWCRLLLKSHEQTAWIKVVTPPTVLQAEKEEQWNTIHILPPQRSSRPCGIQRASTPERPTPPCGRDRWAAPVPNTDTRKPIKRTSELQRHYYPPVVPIETMPRDASTCLFLIVVRKRYWRRLISRRDVQADKKNARITEALLSARGADRNDAEWCIDLFVSHYCSKMVSSKGTLVMK